MPAEVIEVATRLTILRRLRALVTRLAGTAEADHESFEHIGKSYCYFRLPSKPLLLDSDISVSPTCTAWMALASTGILRARLDKEKVTTEREALRKLLSSACEKVFAEAWNTGRLPENNAFTAAVVARGVSFLVRDGLLDAKEGRELKRNRPTEIDQKDITQFHERTLSQIIIHFLERPESRMFLEPFPASPTIAFWFIDAAKHLNVELDLSCFKAIAAWGASEFRRLFSLVSMRDTATMDPINLAMAACLCSALCEIGMRVEETRVYLQNALFPTESELQAGVRAFFREQNSNGVWEKYFPIFHYPASGPNYCWHFEVLEAVVSEFPDLLRNLDLLEKLGNSVDWLQSNRHEYLSGGKASYGWNGGGDIQAVRQNQPESWPTSVAHVFLSTLKRELDVQLKRAVLEKYAERVQVFKPNPKAWSRYMDSDFKEAAKCGIHESRASVKKLVDSEILVHVEASFGPALKLKKRRSAVLFGPPGTAKTSLCKAVAERLGWAYLDLSPSDFLGGGLNGIYGKVNEVFEDLSDLYGVVVLFDEMDALVRNRESSDDEDNQIGVGQVKSTEFKQSERQLDVTETLLTTSMLPKLTRLHDEARLIYFMATNYIGTFDGAIIRSGRFDLLIHLGPPSSIEKVNGLVDNWFKHDEFDSEATRDKSHEKARKILEAILKNTTCREAFDRFTFGEVGKFFDALKLAFKKGNVSDAIVQAGEEELQGRIVDWAGEGQKTTLWEYVKKEKLISGVMKSAELRKFEKDASRVSIQ